MNLPADHLGRPMSLRDWFAGMALNGLLSSSKPGVTQKMNNIEVGLDVMAYEIADAMLKERMKDK